MNRLEHKTTFKIFGKRYFVSVLAGKDHRAKDQSVLKDRRSVSPSFIKAFIFGSVLMWMLIAAALVFVAAVYLIKTYMGFDLFPGSSPIPEFLHWIRLCHAV